MLQDIEKTPATPESPRITAEEARAMARAVVRLFDRWQITAPQARAVLGGLSARTYARWKAGDIGRIDRDLAARLSLLMGIHKGLRTLFSDPARGYAWIRQPNRVFQDRTPIEVMAQEDIVSLQRVRIYLSSECGGW